MVIPTSYTVALATVVREKVEAAGINPHALADATGIPRSTLKRSLAGDRNFKVEHLAALANHLGCNVSDLTLAAESAA